MLDSVELKFMEKPELLLDCLFVCIKSLSLVKHGKADAWHPGREQVGVYTMGTIQNHDTSLVCLSFMLLFIVKHGVNYVNVCGIDCMLFCTESTFCITGIITGSIKERRKVKVVHGVKKGQDKKQVGHSSHILSIALSSDGQFLVCLLA